MGMSIGNIKPSTVILYNEEPYTVIECTHVKLARGPAFCKAKIRNLRTSQVLDCTLRDSDGVSEAPIEERKLQHLYREQNTHHFLDSETYEDIACNRTAILDAADWLKDNLEITGLFYKDELINVKLPATLVLRVIETEPGYRGDTVKSGNKAATLETGVVIQVPLFVNKDDLVKVDTQNKQYLGRM